VARRDVAGRRGGVVEPSCLCRRFEWAAIGFEIAKHYVETGQDVVLTGQSQENVDAAVAALDGRPTGLVFDLAEPHTIAPALAGVGRVRHLAIVAIDRDQNSIRDYDSDRATHLAVLKLVGYAETVHAPSTARRGPRSCSSAVRHVSSRTAARRPSPPSMAASRA
jgi:NAD(P)-dependent dehydrogenase (short-subunit alcohol dehydrogenase family)